MIKNLAHGAASRLWEVVGGRCDETCLDLLSERGVVPVRRVGTMAAFIRSFIHSFVHSFVRSVGRSVGWWVGRSVGRSFIHLSRACWLPPG